MDFAGIDSVIYGVEDMATGRRYFTDWGLKKTSDTKSRVVFETEQGTRVILRPADAPDLPKAAEPGSTVREVVWGVKSKKHIAALQKELARDRDAIIDKDGVLHSTDHDGFGIAFKLWTHKKPSERTARRAMTNCPAVRERIGKHGTLYPCAKPVRLGHVVFSTPDFEASGRFYTERLGFHVSDWQKGEAIYLRCATESDHHNLFYMTRETKAPTFHHLAFEVRDIHEVIGGGCNFTDKGWKTAIGPGRHTVSSAYFWYFKNPCGGMTEYFCDMDVPDSKWKPKKIPPSPATFAEWALPEGISWMGGGPHDR